MPSQFFDSVFKYTDPVRYFKANDPYYYEVDNIPLKQLQENCNFLKDQIERLSGISTPEREDYGIDRSGFTELQPYVDETNNIVRVRPGRYTARINDAYTIEPLQFITQTLGFNLGESKIWSVKTNIDELLRLSLDKVKDGVIQNALNMNGFFERIFTYPVNLVTDRLYAGLGGSGRIGASNLSGTYNWPYPNQTGYGIWYNTTTSSMIFPRFGNTSTGKFINNRLEADFIKRWRGVIRTAIVDVPQELSIQVPSFDDDDLFFINASGQRQTVFCNHRIDLVFIYSKPIDMSAVSINDGIPRQINSPILGILKGAGLGVNLTDGRIVGGSNIPMEEPRINLQDNNILSVAGDEFGLNTGFSGVKGSFPSPEDLMNISPLLSENLETDNFALIGQSILPVAYIVVRRNARVTAESNAIVLSTDVYDIRPFFRTTELSYNERAGLAAAVPQASIANPVATEGYVDHTAELISERINEVEARIPALPPITPRVVGVGTIKGGLGYGVEGVLKDFLKKKFNTNETIIDEEIRRYFGYPNGTIFNYNPDWDLARWTTDSDLLGGNPGSKMYDWINYSFSKRVSTRSGRNTAQYFPSGLATSHDGFTGFPVRDGSQADHGPRWPRGYYSFFYVSKTIKINKANVPWMADYKVNVTLSNCVPLSSRRSHEPGGYRAAPGVTICNSWVSKREISSQDAEFTIFVAWAAEDQYRFGNVGFGSRRMGFWSPKVARVLPLYSSHAKSGVIYNGFAVINKAIMSEVGHLNGGNPGHETSENLLNVPNPAFYGDTAVGVALYPTVQFEIIGIPSSFQPAKDFRPTNTSITLI